MEFWFCIMRTALKSLGLLVASLVVAAAEDAEPYGVSLVNWAELSALDVFRECDACPDMIVMPPGSFMMGPREGESWSSLWDDWGDQKGPVGFEGPDGLYNLPHEGPQHKVLMDTPYAMAVNEVTHAEWMICVKEGGCSHSPDHRVVVFRKGYVQLGPDHPVINVSLLDIEEYITWLNAHVGADV
jgi:formylglycine-generating enzyme required for sulfatase activity